MYVSEYRLISASKHLLEFLPHWFYTYVAGVQSKLWTLAGQPEILCFSSIYLLLGWCLSNVGSNFLPTVPQDTFFLFFIRDCFIWQINSHSPFRCFSARVLAENNYSSFYHLMSRIFSLENVNGKMLNINLEGKFIVLATEYLLVTLTFWLRSPIGARFNAS